MNIRKLLCSFILITGITVVTFALDAKVVSVSGKVEVQTSDGTWKALSEGDSISKGDVISTGFKSEAKFSIGDSVLSVGPLTRLTLEQLAANTNKDEARLFLTTGSVQADVNQTESKRIDFKVRSPAATASVRGTSFSFRADGKLTTSQGLVSKGPAESSKAEVEESSEATSFVPESGESTATTSTSKVSASYGIPVYAGQTSTTDSITGQATAPQAERENTVSKLAGSPQTLSSQEGFSNSVVKQGAAPKDNNATKNTGNVVVVLSVKE